MIRIESQSTAPKGQDVLDEARIAVDRDFFSRRNSQRVRSITPLEPCKAPADSVQKLLIRTTHRKPEWVLYLSPDAAPDAVADCMRRVRLIRMALGPRLSHAVLAPISEGAVRGRSFALVPYYPPAMLDRSGVVAETQRLITRPALMHWLQRVVEATRDEPSSDEMAQLFLKPLETLAQPRGLSRELREAAALSARRIERNLWKPLVAMEHGDLWAGNILRPCDHGTSDVWKPWQYLLRSSFVVVDWYGSRLRGRPIYDLVRLGRSLNLTRGRLRSAVRAHTEALDCDERDAMGYLLASLGGLALQADNFPMARFVPLAQSCFCCLAEAIGRP